MAFATKGHCLSLKLWTKGIPRHKFCICDRVVYVQKKYLRPFPHLAVGWVNVNGFCQCLFVSLICCPLLIEKKTPTLWDSVVQNVLLTKLCQLGTFPNKLTSRGKSKPKHYQRHNQALTRSMLFQGLN